MPTFRTIKDIKLRKQTGTIHATLYDGEEVCISATLAYIIQAAKERNYTLVIDPKDLETIFSLT